MGGGGVRRQKLTFDKKLIIFGADVVLRDAGEGSAGGKRFSCQFLGGGGGKTAEFAFWQQSNNLWRGGTDVVLGMLETRSQGANASPVLSGS